MKKLLIAAALAFVAAPIVQAGGTFGLFTCKSCNKCNVCIRPYNAFSPVCVGGYNGDIMSMPGNCMSGGCANMNYMNGNSMPMGIPVPMETPMPMGQTNPGIKGAYMVPGNPANFYPVYMQNGYQVPMRVMPYGAGPAMVPLTIPSAPQQN